MTVARTIICLLSTEKTPHLLDDTSRETLTPGGKDRCSIMNIKNDFTEIMKILIESPLRKLAHVIYVIFSAVKIHKENFDILNIFAQNIDCGCMLEPPH